MDAKTIQTIVSGTKKFVEKTGRKNAVVGLSGGVDSATVCALLCKALGPKRVFAFHLPAGDVSHLADAAAVAEKFACNFEVADLSAALQQFSKTACPKDREGRGNIASRLRMVFLYAKSRDLNAVVAGTSNKSEIMLGYFTKFGDGGVDFEPIGALFKAQVYEVAKALGVPKSVLEKPPTAGLWPGQTDESELGASYAKIDRVLEEIEAGTGKGALEKKFGKKTVQLVMKRMAKNGHKLELPESISLK